MPPFDVDDILQLTLTTPLLDLPKLPSMELLEEVEEDEEDVEDPDELDTVAVFTPTSMPPWNKRRDGDVKLETYSHVRRLGWSNCFIHREFKFGTVCFILVVSMRNFAKQH